MISNSKHIPPGHSFILPLLPPPVGVKQYQLGHKSSFPHLRDVMWTQKNQKQAGEFDPKELALPLCMHTRVPVKPKMTSSSIHHRQKGRALPSAVQPSLFPPGLRGGKRRGGEGGRESRREESRRRTGTHSLVKLKQYVRQRRPSPHQI